MAIPWPVLIARCAETARLMVGLPDYERYLRHVAEHHPGREPMSRAAFVADRQRARYGAGSSRCC